MPIIGSTCGQLAIMNFHYNAQCVFCFGSQNRKVNIVYHANTVTTNDRLSIGL